MSIKDKPLKKCHSDARITIDVIHNDIISDYTKEKSELKFLLKFLTSSGNSPVFRG